MDKIGYFKGKAISEISREELLDFATWAGERIASLEGIEKETEKFRINKEVLSNLKK